MRGPFGHVIQQQFRRAMENLAALQSLAILRQRRRVPLRVARRTSSKVRAIGIEVDDAVELAE